MFSKEGWESVMHMHDKQILRVDRDPFNSVSVYVDLKNPLLLKYGFDPADFLKGSKEAFRQINMAIASKDLFNFSNGFVKSSATNDLLKSAVSPDIYNACIAAAKNTSALAQAHKNATGVQQTTMTHCTVLDSELRSITVKVLDDADVDEVGDGNSSSGVVNCSSSSSDSTGSSSGSSSGSIGSSSSEDEGTGPVVLPFKGVGPLPGAEVSCGDEETKSVFDAVARIAEKSKPKLTPPTPTDADGEAKSVTARSARSTTDKMLARYPLGSVATIIEVQFTAKEVYKTQLVSGEDLSHERTSSQIWTFVGELSGKTEMDWVAATFRFTGDLPGF